LFAFAAVDWFRQLAQYDNLGLLGRGNYAEVYKGRRKVDGKLIAIKNIKVKSPTACTSTHTRASRKFCASVHHCKVVCWDRMPPSNYSHARHVSSSALCLTRS